MTIIINPGSGPVVDADVARAGGNMTHFVTDLGDGWEFMRLPKEKDYGEGRYAFLVMHENVCHEIQMPGIRLENVRYMSEEQNIWDYPRLYVDDDSWVWSFALNAVLNTDDEDSA